MWLRVLAIFVACILIGACGQEKPKVSFQSVDITGAAIGGPLVLTGHDGKTHRLEDYRGKVVVLFFGFTHCPEVCPTTLYELSNTMKQLGAAAEHVQVLFVSVDPERDDVATLARYVPAFDKRFVGLTGSPEQIKSVADSFKIVYQKVNGKDPKNYSVDHSAGSYILDREGKIRLFVNYGSGSSVFTHDIAELLRS
ncbi:SCO family protein [Burkholderiaceae bacterium DAT-1]|nr:SCO family protein [Burkholderiaceae bacterium DAT-1]